MSGYLQQETVICKMTRCLDQLHEALLDHRDTRVFAYAMIGLTPQWLDSQSFTADDVDHMDAKAVVYSKRGRIIRATQKKRA